MKARYSTYFWIVFIFWLFLRSFIALVQIMFIIQNVWHKPLMLLLIAMIADSIASIFSILFCFLYSLRVYQISNKIAFSFLIFSVFTQVIMSCLAFYIHFNSTKNTFSSGILFIIVALFSCYIAFLLFRNKK
jgi:hypothetical protein